jgi:hypothetical protein
MTISKDTKNRLVHALTSEEAAAEIEQALQSGGGISEAQVDQKDQDVKDDLIGTASASGDTLGELEDQIESKEEEGVAQDLMDDHLNHSDPHPQYALDADLDAVLAGIAAIPTGSATSTIAASAASTTFVDVMTTTVTLMQANVIHGIAIANLTASVAAAVAGFRVIVETPEITLFTAVADVASSLNNTYFTFNKTSGAFYVWYNVGGAGVDPAPGGTGIMVSIAANATAAQVATATISALASHGGAAVVGQSTQFRITNTVGGVVADSSAGTSGFTVLTEQQGAASSNGSNHNISLANTTDTFTASAQHFFSAPGGGTFLVKAQIQRVSGTGTVNFARGSVFGQGQQAYVNPLTPSRIVYVSKNGSDGIGDGSWSKPFATIGKACQIAQAFPSDFNTPVAIAIAPGVGSTQYSETAPINITKGGLCIYSMGSQDFKGVQVHLSGAFNVNMSGSSLFFSLIGFEINCASSAGFAGINAALHVTGSSSQRIFCGSMVLNSNSAAKGAIYCDNASATVTCTNSEIKAGTSAGPNVTPIKMIAGNFIAYDCDMANRQSANAGLCMELGTSVASVTLHDGQVAGSIQKDSDNTTIIMNGTIVSSGVNACIEAQATAGTGAILIYKAVFNSSNAYAITGGENCFIGRISYIGTTNDLDPLLNGGAGPSFYSSDIKIKYRANPADWDVSAPDSVSEALDRMASLLKTLNSGNPIP